MSEHFFTVPTLHGEAMAKALNAFLASHRVAHVRRRFVDCGAESFWAYAVTAVSDGPAGAKGGRERGNGPKLDYRTVLSAPEFGVFSKLREVRKALSQEEGMPLYSVALNESLADMVRKRMTTAAAMTELKEIPKRFHERFEALLKEEIPKLEPVTPKAAP